MIWEELDQSLIFIDLAAEKNTDVLKKMGEALVSMDYAKESYVDALVNRERKFPTGLDIGGIGIAIPHTDAAHVNKEGIAIAVLNHPVQFGQMGTENGTIGVRLVFMLSIIGADEHLEQLKQIMSVIQDTNVLKKMLKAKESAEIIGILREKENEM